MSYCRFSTNNFACDLYAYESGEGFVIHVAGNRHVGDAPKVDWEGFATERISAEDLVAQRKAQSDWLGKCEHEAIALPHAGASFCEPDLVAFKARLTALRALGYRFPDDVLAAVDDEIAEASSPTPTTEPREIAGVEGES